MHKSAVVPSYVCLLGVLSAKAADLMFDGVCVCVYGWGRGGWEGKMNSECYLT